MKFNNTCKSCAKKITGVEKWGNGFVYCVKCFRVIEKEIQRKKDEAKKNWYRPEMTDDEYFHYVYDNFC
jgi:hypothetical protein